MFNAQRSQREGGPRGIGVMHTQEKKMHAGRRHAAHGETGRGLGSRHSSMRLEKKRTSLSTKSGKGVVEGQGGDGAATETGKKDRRVPLNFRTGVHFFGCKGGLAEGATNVIVFPGRN